MTKQEIEIAIKNGESVWGIYKKTNRICEIKSSEINKIHSYTITWGKEYYCYIKDLFKTKAEAEHYLHHANVTRTETLPFLTWKEFLEKKAIHFIDNKGIDFVLCITDNKIKLMVFFMVSKTWDLTEENFYKAYDECKKLFLGENND